jgi:hypothetical protein
MKFFYSLLLLAVCLTWISCKKDEAKVCATCNLTLFISLLKSTGCEDGNDVKVTNETFGIKQDTVYKDITLEQWKSDRKAEGYNCN